MKMSKMKKEEREAIEKVLSLFPMEKGSFGEYSLYLRKNGDKHFISLCRGEEDHATIHVYFTKKDDDIRIWLYEDEESRILLGYPEGERRAFRYFIELLKKINENVKA